MLFNQRFIDLELSIEKLKEQIKTLSCDHKMRQFIRDDSSNCWVEKCWYCKKEVNRFYCEESYLKAEIAFIEKGLSDRKIRLSGLKQ